MKPNKTTPPHLAQNYCLCNLQPSSPAFSSSLGLPKYRKLIVGMPEPAIYYYAILNNTMTYYVILRNTMQYYAIVYNAMQRLDCSGKGIAPCVANGMAP